MKEIDTNELNIVCSRYRVVGIKDAIHRLKDAIEKSTIKRTCAIQKTGLPSGKPVML